MPLDSRKVAHIAANRSKIAAGRSETVTFVTASGGLVGYQAVDGCLWYDAGAVPAGVADRVGTITRAPWDALLVVPGTTAIPDDLRCVARTATATSVGVAAAQRYSVLDKRRAGLGTTGSGGGGAYGDRWVLKLRLLR
jgi:hypothetical protein